MSDQKSHVKPYLPWDHRKPNHKGPQFGVLSKLHGTWVNCNNGPKGLHTTIMPSPGTSSETIFGVFHFKSQEYREQLQFTKINGAVRNRGGSNEQFTGAVKYKTAIVDCQKSNLLHFENGMYIWLGDNTMPWKADSPFQDPPTMFSHESTEKSVEEDGGVPVIQPNTLGPQFVPPHSISRQGVIPHGSTIHLMGNHKSDESGTAPHIADLWEEQYLAVDSSMGFNPATDLIHESREKPAWTKLDRKNQNDGGVNSGRAYLEQIFNHEKLNAKFPYTVQPNLKLIDANESLDFKSYDVIELDTVQKTGLQGGIINNAMIDRYCRVVRMRLRMWIEQIYHNEKVIDQLQYEQIVDWEFMFASDGSTTRWPHIQVNTLRRVEDLSPDEWTPIKLPKDSGEDAETLKSACPVNHDGC